MVVTSPEIESSLEQQIAPWLEHMRWRKDFAEWRDKRIWQENYQADMVADLRKFASSIRGPVLDLGAGMGGFAVALARDGRPVVAMDFNPAYCGITRTRARRYDLDLPVLAATGEALPFASASFAVLTCWDVMEHVQNPAQLLTEIARVLKPGGVAFVTAINRLALVDPHYHLRFVNWVPRPLGEKYIAWRQRTKTTSLQDRQKLSEMHYYTYGGAVRLAASRGLEAHDLLADKSRFHSLPAPLGRVLYLLWRTFGMGTYRLLLIKPDNSHRSAG